jgi:hypothetical protein
MGVGGQYSRTSTVKYPIIKCEIDKQATRFERVKLQQLLYVPSEFIFKTSIHSALKIYFCALKD